MANEDAARYAIAIFRDWSDVLCAVAALSHAPNASCALSLLGLSRLFDDPVLLATMSDLSPALRHAIGTRLTLAFGQLDNALSCTAGALADQLLHHQQGAKAVVEVLSTWMLTRQAARLDEDIRRSRALLWARLFSPEQEQATCTILLDARPLRLEVHDLKPIHK